MTNPTDQRIATIREAIKCGKSVRNIFGGNAGGGKDIFIEALTALDSLEAMILQDSPRPFPANGKTCCVENSEQPDACNTTPEKMKTAEEWAQQIGLLKGEQASTLNLWMIEQVRRIQSNALASKADAVPDGWKLVPIEPTEAMFQNSIGVQNLKGFDSFIASHRRTYFDMLAAAPQPPTGKV